MNKKKGAVQHSKKGMVIDCSVVMAWYFSDESNAYADLVARELSKIEAFVPTLWSLEIANVLVIGERRKRSTQARAERFLQSLVAMPIITDDETNLHAWNATMSLARTHNLSAYDAAYLELAMRKNLPLATLDAKLKTAAQTIGVTLYGVH